MTRWRTRGAVGLTAALSLGLLISTTSGFSQADDRLPDVLSCEQYLAADPATVPAGRTVLVPAATACALTDVALPGDLVVAPGGELTLTSATVAGSVTADAAFRVSLTDVKVAGTVTSTAAGTVPGPVVDPALLPVVDPTVPAPVLPVVALTRVDAESTIDITGTVGGVVVAGTDLLGTLTVADTTGDLLVAAAEQPAPVASTSAEGTAAETAVADGAAAEEATTEETAADGTAAADPIAAAAVAVAPELPPVRTLVGTDLELSRITGAIVVDGTTVPGQVRLQQNAAAPLFGPAATVAGGVVEVQPEPAPTTPPVVPAPTPEQPVEPAPGTTTPPPADPTDDASAPTTDAPAEGAEGGAADPEESTDGSDTSAPQTDDAGSDTGADTDPTEDADPTTGSTTTGSTTTGSPSSAPSAGRPGSPDASAPAEAATDTDTDAPAAASTGGPVLPDGLTVDFGSAALVDLGSLRPVQGLLTADGSLSPVSLTDTRAGAPGWSVSAQLTDFAGGNRFIGAANLGWTPKLIDAESGAELGPDVAPGATSGEGLSVIRRLGSAAPGAGSGTTVLGADLRLQLTDPVDPGTYTATLVITVLS